MTFRWLPFLYLASTTFLPAAESLSWHQTDDSLSLERGGRTLWQLNFKRDQGKPYFHPLCLADGTVLTAARPVDHPWHRGLWWSWKLINGINYWEEDKKTGLSNGRTDLMAVNITTSTDDARIEMELSYHPPDQPAVLTEKRLVIVTTPDPKGNYSIDWDCTFTAGSQQLKFDRTIPTNWSGGYAGLGLRFAPETKSWNFTSSIGIPGATNNYGAKARWLDFNKGGGAAIFDNPGNPRYPTWWYPNQSFPFCNAAFLFREPYVLPAGGTLRLRYRVLIHSEAMDKTTLDKEWARYAQPGAENGK
jgi:hypothetical protein